jgi:hypothetical protein
VRGMDMVPSKFHIIFEAPLGRRASTRLGGRGRQVSIPEAMRPASDAIKQTSNKQQIAFATNHSI